jgi:replication initiation and membrane attachment protein DnaB
MLDRMRNSSKETTDAVFPQILESLKNKLPLSYFENETTIEGEKVVSKITANDLQRLSGSVAYIGDNKDLINFIQSNLPAGTEFTSLDKKSVQGAEFDYVIVDSDWDGMLTKGADGKFKYEANIENASNLLRDLYTMISRSRKGSLIIDNQISNVLNSVKEEYTTRYDRLSDEVIKRFIDSRVSEIEGFLNSIEETKKPKEPEKKKKERKKKADPEKKDEPEEKAEDETLTKLKDFIYKLRDLQPEEGRDKTDWDKLIEDLAEVKDPDFLSDPHDKFLPIFEKNGAGRIWRNIDAWRDSGIDLSTFLNIIRPRI